MSGKKRTAAVEAEKVVEDELGLELEGETAPVVDPKIVSAVVVPLDIPVVVAEVKSDSLREREVVMTEQQSIAESRTVLKQKPAPGTRYFESPEGYIVVGEESRDRVWCAKANKGKGMWINPVR